MREKTLLTSPKLLILGYGDIGQRVGQLAIEKQWNVTGVRRSPPIATADVTCVQGDATDASFLKGLFAQHPDNVLISVTPDERNDDAYTRTYVGICRAVAEAAKTTDSSPRILFVSSTAVYGQDATGLLDETSPTEPSAFNGKRLLDAEHWIRGLPNAICLRASGIYGPGRSRLIDMVKTAALPATDSLSHRIHADDLARAIIHLMSLDQPEPIYIATDNTPVGTYEVLRWIAKRLNREVTLARSTATHCRFFSNGRLRATGFSFNYPSFKEGYSELLITQA